MASAKEKFNWSDAFKILLALVASGFAWTVDNQEGVISLVAMLVVWVLGMVVKRFGYKIGKVQLTIFLFLVSVGLALLFQPVAFPIFPAWGGEVITFVGALLTWAGALLALGGEIFVWATGIYNILLAKVLAKFEPS